MSGIQFLAGLGLIVMPFYPFDRTIRKLLGVKKAARQKEFLTKYEKWVKCTILLIFAFIAFRLGIDSPYLYLVVVVLMGVIYGFEAILQKKYSEDSKEYRVTLIQGCMATLLMIVLILIYNIN